VKIAPTNNGKDCLITDFRLGQFFSLLSGLPARKKWLDRNLVFQPSGAAIDFLLTNIPEAKWTGGAEVFRDNYLKLKMEEENTRHEKKEQLVDSGYEYRTVPFAHQRHCFLLSRDKESFAIFHEQGCGKTKVAIDTAAYNYELGRIDTLIVLTKIGVHSNWITEEIPEHLPERIPHIATFYRNSWPKAEYDNMLQAAKTARGVLRIITFYVEGINHAKQQDMLMAWLENSKALFVIDESSTIKNASADRTKFIIKAGKLAVMRRIMTGTPITRGLENYYSQFKFLDSRIIGHESFYTFRAQFCIMGGFERRQIVSYKNIAELVKIVDGHSHRVLKKDCLDLPPKIYQRRPFELSAAQRKLYDALRKNAIEEIQALLGEEEGLKRAQEIVIVRALRLQQVACGLSPNNEPELLDGEHPRLQSLLDAVEEAEAGGSKVIVWFRFAKNLEQALAKFGSKAVAYWGKVGKDERILNVQRFQTEERIRIFAATSAAAYGLTLTAAQTSIYHSQNSSLDLRLQSEDRNHRIGSSGDHILYVDQEAMRTVDRKIIRALISHKSLADEINQDPISIFMEEGE
jgi:hypothetical protein